MAGLRRRHDGTMMALFNKRDQPTTPEPETPTPSAFSAGLPGSGAAIPASMLAHSEFIKRAKCTRCGAPKTLPSKTAYLYCDYCGSLVDYDFRVANAGTNSAVTNTIYERIAAPCRLDMEAAKARGDADAYRRIMLYIFGQWIEECPQAVSPRAKTDPEFRQRMIAYCAEAAVCKDLEPHQQLMESQMAVMLAAMPRIPTPDGAWMLGGDFWPVAESWKKQMELAYERMERTGVSAMDPDDPPPGLALKMEHSVFCQAYLPHLTPEQGEYLLGMYGLSGDYDKAQPQPVENHRCGGCGADLHTVVGARVVVCEECGKQIDIATGGVPCRNCGAALSFPVTASRVNCPYCQVETQRV